MIACEVNGSPVPIDRVFTHWTGWRITGYTLVPYRIVAPFAEVIHAFGSYWDDVIEREQDPELDGGENLEGLDAELHDARYPRLAEMLNEHGSLFCRYVLFYLQSEFVGYLVAASKDNVSRDEFEFFIQSLSALSINNDTVSLEGNAIEWKPYRNKQAK